MALVKDDLTTTMINATKSCPDGGADAMKALGKAIEDYLVDNTDAQYSWVAAMTSTPFTPDPQTSFKAKLSASGSNFSSTPDSFDAFISDLAQFLNKIKINAADGWSLPPLATGAGTFTASQLGEFADESDCDGAMKDAFGIISQGIIDGWISYFAPAGSGTHSQYTGAASLVSVS